MEYLAIAVLVAACATVLVAWGRVWRHRREVIGSALIYQTDKNWYISPQ